MQLLEYSEFARLFQILCATITRFKLGFLQSLKFWGVLSNVESQINARFKRKQKMQWLRGNVHNLLQVRSAIYSNEWQAYQAQIDIKLTA